MKLENWPSFSRHVGWTEYFIICFLVRWHVLVFLLYGSGLFLWQSTSYYSIKPPELNSDVQADPMTCDVPSQVYSYTGKLTFIRTEPNPYSGIFGRVSLKPKSFACAYYRVFQESNMSSCVEIVLLKRENEVSRHLSWAMEGGLPATQRLVKFSSATSPEVGLLLMRKRTNFSPAAGVSGRGLESNEDRARSLSRRLRGFVI